MEGGFFLLVIGVIIVSILFRLGAGSMDGDRVRSYIEEQGGQLLEIHWSPFGRGWFGEESDRIYEIVYVDREGRAHEATCKMSLFTGVYLTADRVISRDVERPVAEVEGGRSAESLAEENRRLKEELARLKGE
jgi:hypothetical protein